MTIRTLTLAVAGLALLTSAASASQAVTLSKVSLLANPVAGSAGLATIEQGSKVGVVWCGDSIGFCIIQFHAKQGFVAIADLELIGLDKGDEAGPGGQSHAPGASPAPGGPQMVKGVAAVIINNNSKVQP